MASWLRLTSKSLSFRRPLCGFFPTTSSVRLSSTPALQKRFFADSDLPLRTNKPILPAESSKQIKNSIISAVGHVKKRVETARYSDADVLVLNSDLVFLGAGITSNVQAWKEAMNDKLFNNMNRVAVVRDVFDRDSQRASLNTILRLVKEDVALVDERLNNPLRDRLVNEYVRTGDGSWFKRRHDIPLTAYLHQNGFHVQLVKDVNAPFKLKPRQCTNNILMVAPTSFVQNEEATKDNSFMGVADKNSAGAVQSTVLREYSSLYHLISQKIGANVHLFTHEPFHNTPDACFPNNWFSTHGDLETGSRTLVYYPMKVLTRRNERRPDIRTYLEQFNRYQEIIDLTREEAGAVPKILEGTGSLVIDRQNKVAYVALSERSHLALSQRWAHLMGYKLVAFVSTDGNKRPIYHTNVMMAIGTTAAVVCAESIENPQERKHFLDSLHKTHKVVEITRQQVNAFCGNILELESSAGRNVFVMSTQAFNGFTDKQKQVLTDHSGGLFHADIATLERIGGGGVRCTIAELF